MRIVRVIARLNVGGPAKHVVWLTAALQSAAFESLLVAGTVPAGEDDMSYFATAQGVTPVFIPEMSREISFQDAVTIWKLYRLFVRERPDIVHTHTAKAGTVGRLAGLCYRWLTPGTLVGRPRACKVVHTYHGHIFHSYYGRFKTRVFVNIERALARFATDRIVVISEQQRREINQEFRVGHANQFAVIRLGLETDQFADWQNRRQPFRDELGCAESTILIGIVGRLTEIKNHDLFLRAALLFKERHAGGAQNAGATSRVRFVIIGDGNLRSALEARCRALGLDEDVIFTGTRRDPEYFYPALDVVALTSRNEGTPLTLIEAMLNGLPTIATAVGGVVDLLGEPSGLAGADGFSVRERGLSVPAGDERALAAGLARLVADAELRRTIGLRAREFALANYGKGRLIEDISSLYHELVPNVPVKLASKSSNTSLASRI